MADMHVESLRYRLEVDESYGRFENPTPLEHETDAYRMRLEDGVLTVEMKEHHATVESARCRVEDDLKAWELDAALSRDHAWLKFIHDAAGARIVDRQPPVAGSAGAISGLELRDVVVMGLARCAPPVFQEYPLPPAAFAASTELEIMVNRFTKAIFDDSQMLPFGYVFLSLLEGSTDRAMPGSTRKKAARQFRIEEKVLGTLGEFTSRRGSPAEAESWMPTRREFRSRQRKMPGCGRPSRC